MSAVHGLDRKSRLLVEVAACPTVVTSVFGSTQVLYAGHLHGSPMSVSSRLALQAEGIQAIVHLLEGGQYVMAKADPSDDGTPQSQPSGKRLGSVQTLAVDAGDNGPGGGGVMGPVAVDGFGVGLKVGNAVNDAENAQAECARQLYVVVTG